MWDGKFVVKNAMEQACKIGTNLRLFIQFLCLLLAHSCRSRDAMSTPLSISDDF